MQISNSVQRKAMTIIQINPKINTTSIMILTLILMIGFLHFPETLMSIA